MARVVITKRPEPEILQKRVPRVAEIVGPGHPDRLADFIAESLVDALREKMGPAAQAGIEILLTNKTIVVGGEGSSHPEVDFKSIIEKILLSYGYENINIIIDYKERTEELKALKGAQDQGICYGGASIECPERYLPIEQAFILECYSNMIEMISEQTIVLFLWDFKFTISLMGKELLNLIVACHITNMERKKEAQQLLWEKVFQPAMDAYNIKYFRPRSKRRAFKSFSFYEVGGLESDTGVTNRKIIMDGYGPYYRNGGGGLRGKDLYKIDRLGTYYARWVAKNIVAAGLADNYYVVMTFSPGKDRPVMIRGYITNPHNRGRQFYNRGLNLCDMIEEVFPTRIEEIYDYFNSWGKFKLTDTMGGHFGTLIPLPWEETNMVEKIKEYYTTE